MNSHLSRSTGYRLRKKSGNQQLKLSEQPHSHGGEASQQQRDRGQSKRGAKHIKCSLQMEPV